jgi:hypothetical protein
VLGCDSTGILRRLLKYPPVEDIISIINMAENYQAYILGGCTSSKPSVLASRNSRSMPVERAELPRPQSPPRLTPVESKPKSSIHKNPLITPSSAGIKISGHLKPATAKTTTQLAPSASLQPSSSTPALSSKQVASKPLPSISPLEMLLDLLTQQQSR